MKKTFRSTMLGSLPVFVAKLPELRLQQQDQTPLLPLLKPCGWVATSGEEQQDLEP